MQFIRLFILFIACFHSMVACARKQDAPATHTGGSHGPDYADTSLFSEEEITFAHEDITLPGTLSVPHGKGPFPAVILVHGSGPHDRDETIFGNKPFRDLAWGLASKGIAVLRYDKRAKVAPMSYANKIFTVKEEVTDDAVAALRFLRTQKKIDAGAVFVLGHSLGATMAPRIASEDGKTAGIIIMAGTARPFEDIIAEQSAYLASTDSSPEMKYSTTMLDTMAAQIRRLTSKDSLSPRSIGGAPAAYFLDFRQENAPRLAAELGIRILVLQGKRDYQVTHKDYILWEKALAGTSTATLKTYESLNHLFMPGEGPSTSKEYAHPNHIPQYVIDDIAGWILASKR